MTNSKLRTLFADDLISVNFRREKTLSILG